MYNFKLAVMSKFILLNTYQNACVNNIMQSAYAPAQKRCNNTQEFQDCIDFTANLKSCTDCIVKDRVR